MPIVRLIFVRVVPEEAKNAEQIWKESWAPLMIIKQPGCLSEKLLRSSDDPGEFISYSEWKDQQSIDAYRVSEAVRKLKSMRDICTEIGRRSNAIRWCSDQSAQSSRSQVFYTI
jgi:quinol monooxygenase YgiN